MNARIVFRYKKLEALAQKILEKNPNATEVLDKLKQLKAEQDQMEEMWEKKNKQLTDAKDLQVAHSNILSVATSNALISS